MGTSPGTPVVARVADAVIEGTIVPSFSRLGPMVRSRLFDWEPVPAGALAGRIAVVTGATSGIGQALADDLARLGAHVHAVGRDPEKVRRTVERITARHPAARVSPHHADLGRLDDVRALSDRLHASTDRVDLLAHVAGALVHEEQRTPDGLELTFQVHVVAAHLLTRSLLSLLRAADDPRVLTMSSGGMYTQRLDVDALVDPPGEFDGTVVYARAKRAQVELNAEWARRRPCDGIGFHAMHPGWVATPGLTAGLPGFARRLAPLLRSPEQGADTATWLSWTPAATAPGGDLWLDRRRRRAVALPSTRTPTGERRRLWEAVERAAGIEIAPRTPDHPEEPS